MSVDIGQKTLTQLREIYGNDKVFFIKCDVTKEEDFTNAWDETENFFGRKIDVLANNAGINHLSGWKKCFDVNMVIKHIILNNLHRELISMEQ